MMPYSFSTSCFLLFQCCRVPRIRFYSLGCFPMCFLLISGVSEAALANVCTFSPFACITKCRLQYFLLKSFGNNNFRVIIIFRVLAEKLNLSNEETERWIMTLIRTSKLDAKIDSKSGTIVMEPNYPNVYEIHSPWKFRAPFSVHLSLFGLYF